MRSPHRAIPFALLLLMVLVLFYGCVQKDSSPEDIIGTETTNWTGPDDQTGTATSVAGEPLDYFHLYDRSVFDGFLDSDLGLAMDPGGGLVVPGETTVLRDGAGVLELVFDSTSLDISTSIDLAVVADANDNLWFQFEPDGIVFNPDDPVRLRFYPHVVDPDRRSEWSAYALYGEVESGRFEPLSTSYTLELWRDPSTGESFRAYCLTAPVEHFSKYAALR
jgi:hypothetical protein